MHAARMQSTNVEFMGTKCLQRIWKRPSTALWHMMTSSEMVSVRGLGQGLGDMDCFRF